MPSNSDNSQNSVSDPHWGATQKADGSFSTSSNSYKAIHYERQTSLKLPHIFDLATFSKNVPHWCSRAPDSFNEGTFELQFEFTLPDRRKIKRGALVFDLVSLKEYEAAQTGLSHASALFDILVQEQYTCHGYTFKTGLKMGPSFIEEEKLKTCALLSLRASLKSMTDISQVLLFAVQAVFSSEELHHMQAVTVSLYFNNIQLGSLEIPCKNISAAHLECAQKYYSSSMVQDILYSAVKDRNVLYAFKTEQGSIRQGMMVKTERGWNPITLRKKEDLVKCVEQDQVREFIPAVNRTADAYPSVITIETDPGDMVLAVLGKEKTWKLNTYVTEKILQLLDAYCIKYMVKFSGNKGWHIQIPVELREPFRVYQEVVKAIVNRECSNLPEKEQRSAVKANLMQLEEVKSYNDPFFMARRFVDLTGAHLMFFDLKNIHTILDLHDLKMLLLRVTPVCREDFLMKGAHIFDSERGPVKVEMPQILSVNPYSKFRRQFKLLIDHSSNKKEGKLRSVFSLHSKTGLSSIPALLRREEVTKFDEKMWDLKHVCECARAEKVYDQIKSHSEGEYPLLELAEKWESDFNYNLECNSCGNTGFESFLKDHRGLLIYLLQNGGEALELLDTPTALWVNAHLWEKTIHPRGYP